jgi:hypothetical protein
VGYNTSESGAGKLWEINEVHRLSLGRNGNTFLLYEAVRCGLWSRVYDTIL